MMKKHRQRTDKDYIQLDDAIQTIKNWEEEILNELAKAGHSWKALDAVLRAAEQVHSPDE